MARNSRRAARRPMLLVLVYAAFLVLIAGVAVADALIVGAHFSSAMLSTTVAHDRALVGLWADSNLSENELSSAFTDERRDELQAKLVALAQRAGIVHIDVRDADGNLLLTNDPASTAGALLGDSDLAA